MDGMCSTNEFNAMPYWAGAYTRPLFGFNLSALYGIGDARRGCVARVKGVLEGVRGCVGCVGCFLVPETAQVELRSGRV